MCAPQCVGDHRGFGVRRCGDANRKRAARPLRACELAARVGARKPTGDPGDGVGDRGRAAVRLREGDRRLLATQQRGVGAPITEHRLVGITGDDGELGTLRQYPHEPGGLRVEMLCVVDQKQLDAGCFAREQVGVRGEGLECRTHEFGRAEGRHGGLWSRHPDRRPQQHDLLVGLCELARGQPLGTPCKATDALQRKGIHTALRAACHQIAQFRREPDGAQRRPQLGRPRDRGVVAVLEVACQ